MVRRYIALYGGSFNPSTQAHRDIGELALASLKVDAVWYLVSPQNPFKSKEGMAPFEARVAMARMNVEGNPKLVVTDIEGRYARLNSDGVIESADTLELLVRDFRDHRFIWVIGADNFASLHTWGRSTYIIDHVPIAVVPRTGFTNMAKESLCGQIMHHVEKAEDLKHENGWFLLPSKSNGINATACRAELAGGVVPDCMRPEVARYAIQKRLYTL